MVEPPRGTLAEARLGRRDRLSVIRSLRHVAHYLLIGNVKARHQDRTAC